MSPSIKSAFDSKLDAMIFGNESHEALQNRVGHDISWSNHGAHGLPESNGYSYHSDAVKFQLPMPGDLPQTHAIGLLTRGPNKKIELDPARPTYVFFHGKTDSGFAKINSNDGTFNSYRRDFIQAFPDDANVVIVNMDREHQPGNASFTLQYEALAKRFSEIGVTENLHLYGESMGAADVTGFSVALLKEGIAKNSQTLALVAGFDELANPAADSAFNARGSAGIALRPYVGTSTARWVIGTDRNLNNLANLARMKELGFNGQIHVAITQEDAHKVEREHGHVVATPYQERLYDHALKLFGESHVSRSHWDYQHTNYPSAEVVSATIALMQTPQRNGPAV